MDIVTIYAQPDTKEPLKEFEGLMKSFKKYGFRECDRLRLVVPRASVDFMAQMQGMLDLLGSGHELIPVIYSTRPAPHMDLIALHNNIFCHAAYHLKGEGSFLYIPFGCEPVEKNWAKTVETVMRMHKDKRFIGQSRKNPEGFDFLSGACVLDYEFIGKSCVWQSMNARNYPFDRAARTMQGSLLSYPLPFSEIEVGGVAEVITPQIKGLITKADRVASEMLADSEDSVSERAEEAIEEFVTPEVVVEPEKAPDLLQEAIDLVAEVPEIPDTVEGLLKEAELEAAAKKVELEESGEVEKEPAQPVAKKAAKKKSGKKKTAKKKTAKKKVAKKAAKKAAKGWGLNITTSGEDRVDHSL